MKTLNKFIIKIKPYVLYIYLESLERAVQRLTKADHMFGYKVGRETKVLFSRFLKKKEFEDNIDYGNLKLN